MIGIIGAMEEEVKALADMMSGVKTATVAYNEGATREIGRAHV